MYLRGPINLEELDVRTCDITIDGLLKLRGLPRLAASGVPLPGMTDGPSSNSENLHHLESLDLFTTRSPTRDWRASEDCPTSRN